jgi:hypothetical protein
MYVHKFLGGFALALPTLIWIKAMSICCPNCGKPIALIPNPGRIYDKKSMKIYGLRLHLLTALSVGHGFIKINAKITY